MGFMRRGILSVPPARQQRADPVADLPARHTGADLDHGAGTLQPRQGRGRGWRRIGPGALQRIGTVHPGIGNPDDDLPMPRHWHRHCAGLQHIRPAGG